MPSVQGLKLNAMQLAGLESSLASEAVVEDSGTRPRPVATVVDLFCGAGAVSYGFLQEGFEVSCGYDIDESCRYPFKENNKTLFLRRDIAELDAEEVSARFKTGLPKILVGCAPCQPYSRYSRGRSDPKWFLLKDFARLAVRVRPEIVTMENVPQLVQFNKGKTFMELVADLERADYDVRWKIVNCADFGVPQTRDQLVMICSRIGRVPLPEATHARGGYITVRNAISGMPRLAAGCSHASDPLHCASVMAPINLRRIQASRPGGTWSDWPEELLADCHRKASGKQYYAVYGRLSWNQPAPTITTQFIGFGNGRFGHPEQNRALSLREGALLQTFPPNYAFVSPTERVRITKVATMIANAVPVRLARAVARAIKKHLGDCQ